MKRHSFGVLRLLMLIVLGASLNACIIATYQIAAQEPKEGRTNLTSKYDEAVYFVIPEYYKIYRCKRSRWTSEDCLGPTGADLVKGVSASLNDDMPFGRPVEFSEHIPSEGLVCVVTLNEQPVAEVTLFTEFLTAVTLGLIPFYTTHEYVLSYTFLLDFKTGREYPYTIAKKAMSGHLTGVLVPVVYPFWGDEIAIWQRGGIQSAKRQNRERDHEKSFVRGSPRRDFIATS